MEDFQEISTLARPVDPEYPTHIFILVVSVVSFIGFGVTSYLSGGTMLGFLATGARSSLSIFLAWALGREVDPADKFTGVLAALGQVLVVVIIGVPTLLLPLWALLSFRILNRASGSKATVFDTLIATSLALWLGYHLVWVVPGVSAVVFLVDGLKDDPDRKHIIPGLLTAAGSCYLLLSAPAVWSGFINYPLKLALVLVISVTFLLMMYTNRKGEPGEPLADSRVRLTQLLALLIGLLLPLWTKAQGFHQSAIFWSVLGSTAVVNTSTVIM